MFASDTSYVNLDSIERGSTTFTMVAGNLTCAANLSHPTPPVSPHGEVYGILSASLAAREHQLKSPPQVAPTLFTDHLNSVKTVSTKLPDHVLNPNPAHSPYRWIADVWDSMRNPPHLIHVKARTSSSSVPARLNRHADYIASTSMLHSSTLCFVESNISPLITDRLSRSQPVVVTNHYPHSLYLTPLLHQSIPISRPHWPTLLLSSSMVAADSLIPP